VARDPWAVMNGSSRVVDAEDARVAIGALWTPGSSAVDTRQGLRPGPGDPGRVQQTGTPGPNVTVNSFQGLVTATRGAGGYIVTEPAKLTLPILDIPADPSNARRDLILYRQYDTYYGDPATQSGVIRVPGTPSGSPVDPNLSAYPDYVLLARVRVPAGASSITDAMIDDLRPGWTVGLGGVLPVRGESERDDLDPYPGMTIDRLDLGWQERHDGTAWRAPNGVTTTALSSITHPLTGQTAVLSSDQLEYRWSGSSWQATRYVAPAPVLQRRNNTPTPVPAATNTRVPWDTEMTDPRGISYSAANRSFTFARAGRYTIDASIRVDTLTTLYLWAAKTAGTGTGNRGKTAASQVLNLGMSAKIRVLAGAEEWSVWMWSALANNLVRESTTDGESVAPWIHVSYDGPL